MNQINLENAISGQFLQPCTTGILAFRCLVAGGYAGTHLLKQAVTLRINAA